MNEFSNLYSTQFSQLEAIIDKMCEVPDNEKAGHLKQILSKIDQLKERAEDKLTSSLGKKIKGMDQRNCKINVQKL